MPARLVPLTAGAGPVITLQRPVLLVGRHPECDVRIDRPQVSRRHCCVAMAYDRLLVRDLGSRNGVRVNGRLVQEAPLRLGDEVAIGPVIYRLEAVAAEQPTPTTPKPRPAPAPAPAPAARPAAGPARMPAPPPSPAPADSLPELPMVMDDSELIPLDDVILDD